MDNTVYITGAGIICAIGNNKEEVLDALINGHSGIGKIQNLNTRHKAVLSVGEVKLGNKQLEAGISNFPTIQTPSRTTLLGIHAAKEALKDAQITDIQEFRTGIVSATSVGGMALVENHFRSFLNKEGIPENINYIHRLDCSDSTEQIAGHLNITAFLSTISTACSSSANAIMYGARLIRHNMLDRVLVGGTDALSRFTINGFKSLQILDPEPCKPFDVDRSGLNLGEGAGFLVLESAAAAKGKNCYARLAGFSNVNEAFHPTASSPGGDGAFHAMEQALKTSGLRPSDIDYINAHGTGTEINDLSEGIAISRLFIGKVPHFSSTKSSTGHALAAAGGIEAVISMLALRNHMIPANLNCRKPLSELPAYPVTQVLIDADLKHIMSNSFGFGGNTSTLIFSKDS